MSYPIMSLPLSMAEGLHKTQNFNSIVQSTGVGYSSAVALKPFPTYDFQFAMDRILGNESALTSVLQQFQGVFALTQGRAGLFLFTDPQDNTVAYANSGMLNATSTATGYMTSVVGDGASTKFQLVRSIGGVAWDIIQALNGSITVKVAGTLTTAFSINYKGVVTFTTAPASGASIQWAGSFYFPCRFSEDTYDAVRVFTINSGIDQWNVSGVKFSQEFLP